MVTTPAAIPITIPLLLIVAMFTSLLLQVPPAVVFTRVVTLPTHTLGLPVIAVTVGSDFMVALVATLFTQPPTPVTV